MKVENRSVNEKAQSLLLASSLACSTYMVNGAQHSPSLREVCEIN